MPEPVKDAQEEASAPTAETSEAAKPVAEPAKSPAPTVSDQVVLGLMEQNKQLIEALKAQAVGTQPKVAEPAKVLPSRSLSPEGAAKEPLTFEQVKAMSPQQVNDDWDRVKVVLQSA